MFTKSFLITLATFLPQYWSTVTVFNHNTVLTQQSSLNSQRSNVDQNLLTKELNSLLKSPSNSPFHRSRTRRDTENVPVTSWQNGTSATCKALKVKEKAFLTEISIKNFQFSLKNDSNPSVAIAWHGDNTGVLMAVTTKEYVSFDVASFTMSDKSNPSQMYRVVLQK